MRDIALSLFIFGLIPFILMRPYVGLLVWSWLGYMNPHRLCWGFATTIPWVQLIAIITLIGLLISKESKRIPRSAFSVLLLMFLLWTGFSTFFAAVPISAWDKWIQFAKVLAMVFLTLVLVTDRARMHWLVWVIAVSIGFYGVKGGIFTILTGGAFHVLGPANSFIAGNNDLAQAFCITLPLMRYLQLQASTKYLRIAWGVALLLTGIATLGTYSRGGFITLAVVAVALFMKSRRRIAIMVVVVALGFVAYNFMPQKWTVRMATIQDVKTVQTVQSRVKTWQFATNVALHHPLVGGGFNVYESPSMWAQYAPEGVDERAVHSIYFRVLGEQGFVGFALFIALLVVSWRSCTKVRKETRRSPSEKWAFDLASMLQVSLLAFMTAGAATTSSYFDLSYQLMAMCSLLYGVLVVERAESASRFTPGRDGSPALEVADPLRGAAHGRVAP